MAGSRIQINFVSSRTSWPKGIDLESAYRHLKRRKFEVKYEPGGSYRCLHFWFGAHCLRVFSSGKVIVTGPSIDKRAIKLLCDGVYRDYFKQFGVRL